MAICLVAILDTASTGSEELPSGGCFDVIASLVGISLAPPARGGMNVSNLQALEDWLAIYIEACASRYLRCLLVAARCDDESPFL